MKNTIKTILMIALIIYVVAPADLGFGIIDDIIVAGILYSIYRRIDVSSCESDADSYRTYDENMYSDDYPGYD